MKHIRPFPIFICLIAMLPTLALSHPGHSQEGGIPHELEHLTWLLLAGFTVIAALLMGTHNVRQQRIRNRQKSDN